MVAVFALPQALSAPQARFLDPRYSVPAVVMPGQGFNATLVGVQAASGAWVVAPGVNASIPILKTWSQEGSVTLLLEVPRNTSAGLYDLCVNAGGSIVCEPRSVWVLEKEPSELTIAHLTDVHVEVIVAGVRSTLFLETALNLVNSLPVDLAVVTGDCVDVGSDIGSLKTLQELINRVRKPTFLLPGNHDHSQTDDRSFSEVYYGRFVGPATWYRVVGPFLLVALDTGYAGYVDYNQLEWLESVLAANKGKVKILMMHHPLFRANLFASINGSWRDFDRLSNYLYASWANRPDEAKELLRLIEEYGVAAVLSGHVHVDGLVIFNGRTWFVTTVTTCGSMDYRGFKIVRVGRDGSVKVIGAEGRNPLAEPSSFVLDGSLVRVIPAADMSASTAVAYLSPTLGLDLQELVLYLTLNASLPPSSYTIYGNATLVEGLELLKYGSSYLAILKMKAPKGWAVVSVSSYEDKVAPRVSLSLYTPRRPVAGRDQVTLYVSASDEGWGVWKVYVDYEADGRRGTIAAREVRAGSYQAELPPLNATIVRLTVKAMDYAGNWGYDTSEIEYAQPPKPEQPAEQPKEEQQPQQQPPPTAPAEEQPFPWLPAAALLAVALAVAVVIVVARKRKS